MATTKIVIHLEPQGPRVELVNWAPGFKLVLLERIQLLITRAIQHEHSVLLTKARKDERLKESQRVQA